MNINREEFNTSAKRSFPTVFLRKGRTSTSNIYTPPRKPGVHKLYVQKFTFKPLFNFLVNKSHLQSANMSWAQTAQQQKSVLFHTLPFAFTFLSFRTAHNMRTPHKKWTSRAQVSDNKNLSSFYKTSLAPTSYQKLFLRSCTFHSLVPVRLSSKLPE